MRRTWKDLIESPQTLDQPPKSQYRKGFFNPMSTDIDASPSPTSSLVSDVAFGLQATGNETAPHNLPATLTRFVGRQTESEHLHTLLTEARLISLVGPGGVGKTRLALQKAWHYVHLPASPFPDGVCFVPLGSAYTEDDLIFTLAETLQIPYFSNINLKKHLTNLLRPREMLFVLDNFEQLTPHAYLLVEILQQAPHLRFLVTTRERLNVYGENAFPLTGLPLDATLETSPAAQLFVQNAKRVNPHFALTPENRPHIAQICRDVDGLPLALEMASSWVRALSPANLG
ncbi:MAG TPA: NB-ARC domain-containing protein, partial [Anaerolineales bacterium]|nr:NB-ARC domain-containing protein [Anaerolineales bacterium]